jgi:hypothetical protein
LQYLVLTDRGDAKAFETLVDAIHAGAKYGHGAKDDKIFVSYRREDTAYVAGRVFDHLEHEFGPGRIFFDVQGIPLGGDFREHIRQAILNSSALLAIIGKKWASYFRTTSRIFPFGRPHGVDYVRTELELALDHNVRILPLLVDGAVMPSESRLPSKISQVSYFQAAPIRAGLDFRNDMQRVLAAIRNPPLHAVA